MKKIIFLISLCFCLFQCKSQTNDSAKYIWYKTQYGMRMPRIWSDSVLNIPYQDTFALIHNRGLLTLRPQDGLVYYADGSKWNSISSSLTFNSGLTRTSNNVQFGGSLLQNTNLSLGSSFGDSLIFKDSGWVRIRTNSSTSKPPLIIENKTSGAFENLYGVGDNVAWRLQGNLSNGFVGLTYYTGGTLRWATGYDGNADHAYIADIRNTPSATIEVDGSTFAAFTRGKVFGIGDLPARDTAKITIYTNGSGYTASDSTNRWIVGQNYNSTFNTTGGAIINSPIYFDNTSTRISGSNTLTNRTMWLRARNAQTNQALFIDSGNAVFRGIGNANAIINSASFFTLANLGVAQDRYAGWFECGRTLTDTLGGTQTFAAGIRAGYTYAAKGYASVPDNFSGGAIDARLSFVANHSGYTGRTFYQGPFLPSNGVTTMTSAISAALSATQSQTGGNSLRLSGWYAGVSSQILMSTGDSVGNFAWFNGGAMQASGGIVDTGFIYYANALPSAVVKKYAFYNVGINDSSIFNGPLKSFNFLADKTITVAGTTGNQTINKISGTVNFAAGTSTLTVTNSLVSTTSNVFCTIRTNDATAIIKNVVPGSGSFVITLNAAATAETSVGFFVIN